MWSHTDPAGHAAECPAQWWKAWVQPLPPTQLKSPVAMGLTAKPGHRQRETRARGDGRLVHSPSSPLSWRLLTGTTVRMITYNTRTALL